MAFAGPLIAIASTAVSTFGAISNANYQAQVARNNYNTALRNAVAKSTAAQEEQRRSDIQYAQLAGQQESTQAASGLDILGASQLRTRATTEVTRSQAAQDIRRNAESAQAADLADAMNAHIQGKAAGTQATLAAISGALQLGDIATGDKASSLIGQSRSLRSKKYG